MISNSDKILNILESVDKIQVTQLAEKSGINRKNIGRYINQLEKDKKISIDEVQNGKIRYKYVSLIKEANKNSSSRKGLPSSRNNNFAAGQEQKINKNIDEFSGMTISQDDLWFLYKVKTGKSTRMKKSELLPKFMTVFEREIQK